MNTPKIGDVYKVAADQATAPPLTIPRRAKIGAKATIVAFDHDGDVVLEFEQSVGGHSAADRTPPGRGWYVEPEKLDRCYTKVNEEKPIMETKERQWSFNITSLDALDYYKLVEDVDYTHPIVLVEAGKYFLVGVHLSLFVKARNSKYHNYPQELGLPLDEYADVRFYTTRSKAAFQAVIEWAKQVKQMPWPKPYKTNVTVTLPKV